MCVSMCVCVAVWDTYCFNRRCADVTAEAKKPPLKRKRIWKKSEKRPHLFALNSGRTDQRRSK